MQNHACFKYILSFFLVLTALFTVNQYRTLAHAAGSDRIYYFNMAGNDAQGNMILVETDGHWGLLDAGHTSARTITDANGAVYSTMVNGLSSQIYCHNGRDAANYMINKLGVRHLDFIVGTHAHSDHIGGIPEVANATWKDSSGITRYLVDSDTTYYYKEYQHISNLEDDLVRYSSNSWHNQAFAYQAETAMENRGATPVDVSKAEVIHGDPGNAYGDYITFNVGNMSFRLYNVHEQTDTGNENVNSIVTVMTNGNYSVVNLADINTTDGAIDKTSQAIAKDFGAVDIVVAGHHGYNGSNTKAMFDALQPDFVIISNSAEQNSWLYTNYDLAAAIPYAENAFGTSFYSTEISYYATVTDLSGNKVYVYSVNDNGDLTNAMNKLIRNTKKTGWVSWIQTSGTLWSYLENGKSVKNDWRKVDGEWYRFDQDGIMQTGWITSGTNKYYLNKSGAMATGWLNDNGKWYYMNPDKNSNTCGRMLKGWQKVGGKWYYFDKNGQMLANTWYDGYYLTGSGAMATGWQKVDGKWYYLDSNGKQKKGWQKIDSKWYYFYENGQMAANTWYDGYYLTDSGAMATGWLEVDGKWYYLDGDGKRMTGWQKVGGKWYYLDGDGQMLANTWYDGYYLTDSGAMATGWLQLDGKWYYLDGDGKKMTGWQKVGGKWYYLDGDGQMLANTWHDGCYLTDSGAMATGWLQLDGKWYYMNPATGNDNGKYMTGWQKISGKWYYFYSDGSMAADTVVDGYAVDSNGVWNEAA